MEILHRHLSRKCDTCQDRKTCTELCPEIEAWVAQDTVPQRELTIGFTTMDDMLPSLLSNSYLTPMEKSILTLLGRGLTRSDVCEVLEISRNTLRYHIYNLRKKS